MNLQKTPTEILIDCFPENQPLYKDSGLWTIRTDDLEDTILEQGVNESFKEFIVRASNHFAESEETFNIDVSLAANHF